MRYLILDNHPMPYRLLRISTLAVLFLQMFLDPFPEFQLFLNRIQRNLKKYKLSILLYFQKLSKSQLVVQAILEVSMPGVSCMLTSSITNVHSIYHNYYS